MSGKTHGIGRNTAKCAAYRAAGRRTANKRKRIAKCNGAAALAAYKPRDAK